MSIEGPFAVDVERKLRTYVVIWRAAKALIGQEGTPADVERSMAAGVLAAFSFEAYLNHVGAVILECWAELERKLTWKAKLLLIAEQLGIRVEEGAMPFQALRELFVFRDALAHGKTQSAKIADLPLPHDFDLDGSMMKMIDAATLRWEQQCEPEIIRKWMDAVEQTVRDVHQRFVQHPRVPRVWPEHPMSEEPQDPFETRSHGRATLKVVRERKPKQ
jgi:hypothetical protein